MPRDIEIFPLSPPVTRALLLLPSGLTAVTMHARLQAPAWFSLHMATLEAADDSTTLSAADILMICDTPNPGPHPWRAQLRPATLCSAPHDDRIRWYAPAHLTLSRLIIGHHGRHTATLTLFLRALPPTSPRHPRVLLARLRRAAQSRRSSLPPPSPPPPNLAP
jgi:hypothetical protein